MSNPMIGIFGGTFDPIHYGHLRAALEVMESLKLEQIRFIPLHRAVHRKQPGTSGSQRLEMLRAAINDQTGFIADDREIRCDSPSYTLHTLQSLRQELGHQVPLCLLLGADAYADFLNWHNPLKIIQLAHLIIMQRPGHELPDNPELQIFTRQHYTEKTQTLSQSPAGKVMFLPVTQLEISASDIRRRVSRGASAQYLLPDPVWKMVIQKKLYL